MKRLKKYILLVILILCFIYISIVDAFAYQADNLPHTQKVSMVSIKNTKKLTGVNGNDVAYVVNAINSKKSRITLMAKTQKKLDSYIDIFNYLYCYNTSFAFNPSVTTTENGHKITITKKELKELSKNNLQYEKKFNEIIRSLGITSNMTEYDAVKRINNWICDNITYDYTYTNTTADQAVMTKTVICSGYAALFKKLCDYYGIQSYIVGSKSLKHAWNIVCVDNIWYEIDTCWNDNSSGQRYWFFLMTKEESARVHGSYEYFYKNNRYSSYEPHYDGISYNISYKMNGGAKNKDNIPLYIPGIDNPLPKPERKGYRFKGWYIGNKKITNTKNMTGNITLTAKWKKI